MANRDIDEDAVETAGPAHTDNVDPVSPGSDQRAWKPPPEFDLIKELNGHAGRLATLLGLAVAASALSLGNGPIKDALTSFDLSAHAFVYGALIATAVCTYYSVSSVINALAPPAPILQPGQQASEVPDEEWSKLVIRKQYWATEAAGSIIGVLLGLGFAWISAYADVNLNGPESIAGDEIGLVVMLVVAGFYLSVTFKFQAALRELWQVPDTELPNLTSWRIFKRVVLGRGSFAPEPQPTPCPPAISTPTGSDPAVPPLDRGGE